MTEGESGPMIAWHGLQSAIPHLSWENQAADVASSPYCALADSIFRFLTQHVRPDGSIYDDNISSALDGQYHFANYVFGAIMLRGIRREHTLLDQAQHVLEYYVRLPRSIRHGAIDFNNFPILLSYLLLDHDDESIRVKALLKGCIDSMEHCASATGARHGNNFVPLRALNHLLRLTILGNRDGDLESAMNLLDATLQWQYADGVFYDYPRTAQCEAGIPHLAYHAKMSLMVLLCGLIAQRPEAVARAIRGFSALAQLVASDGEAFYYGRTNNAIFGYACGILGFRIASVVAESPELQVHFARCENLLFAHTRSWLADDGHLYVVPNRCEQQRCGFDSYMYVTVYNAFMMTMLLLGAAVSSPRRAKAEPAGPSICHLEDAGFVVKNGADISTCINLRGHNNPDGSPLDPRLTCCTPLFLKYRGQDLLPSIPFSPAAYVKNHDEALSAKITRKAREVLAEVRARRILTDYNPLHAGFLTYLEKRNTLYLPIVVDSCEVFHEQSGLLRLQVSGRYLALRARGLPSLWFLACNRIGVGLGLDLRDGRRLGATTSRCRFLRQVFVHDRFIHLRDDIVAPVLSRAWPGFTVRTYADQNCCDRKNALIFQREGRGFALLLAEGDSLRRRKELGTSKGPATWWDISSPQDKHVFNRTIVPFDCEADLQEGIDAFRALGISSTA